MGALDGIRVIDAGMLVQGPQAAQTMSDLGADVIKIELPELGDQARWIPLSTTDLRAPYFEACNRGKRSVTIDLRTAEGQAVLLRLAETADVIISNFTTGTLDGWGLGYDVVSARNPRIIYASGTTLGRRGPAAKRAGGDLAGQAIGGLISTIGVDGEQYTPVGVTIADHIGSQNMALGIMAALISRDKTGRGQRVDVSLLGGQIYAQASEYTAFLLSGEVPGRANYGHSLLHAAYGIMPTADGCFALVGVPSRQREAFYEAIGLPELADDERFQPEIYTRETQKELVKILNKAFVTRTTAEWLERLSAIEVRVAPVHDYAEAAIDPHVVENGYLVDAHDAAGNTVRVVGSPIELSNTPAQVSGVTPELGQNTEEVLLEAGYDWEEISALREAGAI